MSKEIWYAKAKRLAAHEGLNTGVLRKYLWSPDLMIGLQNVLDVADEKDTLSSTQVKDHEAVLIKFGRVQGLREAIEILLTHLEEPEDDG